MPGMQNQNVILSLRSRRENPFPFTAPKQRISRLRAYGAPLEMTWKISIFHFQFSIFLWTEAVFSAMI